VTAIVEGLFSGCVVIKQGQCLNSFQKIELFLVAVMFTGVIFHQNEAPTRQLRTIRKIQELSSCGLPQHFEPIVNRQNLANSRTKIFATKPAHQNTDTKKIRRLEN
jgi:hypothetical protein